jgi:hypothetical protein
MHDNSALPRRLRLARGGIAAITPAAALVATEDPVFAAIAQHREAERALSAALRDAAHDAAAVAALDRAHDALVDWLTTSPTTMAGVLATLDYAASPLGDEPSDAPFSPTYGIRSSVSSGRHGSSPRWSPRRYANL